ATKDRAVQVKWINNLPPVGHSLLPVDDTLLPMRTNGADNRMVVHVHGAKVPAASDGLPWQDFAPGGSLVDTYPNHMTARLMWYHDHADGLTRLNTQAGLAGGYLLTDSVEAGLNLPGPIGSPYDVPLILTNKTFRANGNLWYPRYYPDPTVPAPVPSCVPEFFGDTNLVNGKVWPYLDVQPRKYRFRILNAASARFYRMSLRVLSATGKIASSVLITQIGNEGGFLPAPVIINHSAATGGNGGQLMLAPAERADVIIDFSRYAGKKIVLTNDAPAPFPSGTSPDPNLAGTVGQIMQFRVNDDPADPVDTSSVPSVLTSIPDLERLPWDVTRNLGLWESLDQFGRLIQRLGTAGDGIGGQPMMDPVSETLKLGTIEKWNIVNTTMDVHPIHIHEFNCQVISRQAVNVGYYIKTGNLKFTGPAHDPLPNEQGAWKETFQCPPNTVTTILIDAREGFPGKYVWHCHILEHEEHDMMRPFIVIP
ncbi:MAG: multicopper oxidase domain-containing protein, partial [Armatimonadota bacterium]